MPAAWIHIPEDVLTDAYVPRSAGRYGKPTGLARCYKLETPVDFDGDGTLDEYLVVRVLFAREHMHPEIAIFPADQTGNVRDDFLRRRGGSFTIPGGKCPEGNTAAIEWTIALALSFHDITITDPPPEPEPEPEPEEPQLPAGLDYDPDVLPDETWYALKNIEPSKFEPNE